MLTPGGRLAVVLSRGAVPPLGGRRAGRARLAPARRRGGWPAACTCAPAGGGASFVYLVKRRRVTHAGVATKAASRNAKTLRGVPADGRAVVA